MKNIVKKSIMVLGLTTMLISGAYAGVFDVILKGGKAVWKYYSGLGMILNVSGVL